MNLKSKIESLLFISTHPLSIKKIIEITKGDVGEVEKALAELQEEYNKRNGGIQLMKNGSQYQMVTSGDNAPLIKEFLKDEMTGELTRPSLETLTIIAYRGPITKPEIEQIRGVNCSLILRNLLIRGLIEAKEDKKSMATYYNITFDFMRYLGINDVTELPDYEKLHSNEILEKLFEEERKQTEKAANQSATSGMPTSVPTPAEETKYD